MTDLMTPRTAEELAYRRSKLEYLLRAYEARAAVSVTLGYGPGINGELAAKAKAELEALNTTVSN